MWRADFPNPEGGRFRRLLVEHCCMHRSEPSQSVIPTDDATGSQKTPKNRTHTADSNGLPPKSVQRFVGELEANVQMNRPT